MYLLTRQFALHIPQKDSLFSLKGPFKTVWAPLFALIKGVTHKKFEIKKSTMYAGP